MKIQTCNFFGRSVFAGAVLTFFLVVSAFAEDEYILLLGPKGNPYWNTVASGAEETAIKGGIKATVYQLEGDSSAEEQLNTCFTAIQKKPKFLAIAAVNPSVGIQCLKKAQSAGAQIAELDSTISLTAAEKEGVKISFSVGSDNTAIGRKAAEYAKTLLNGGSANIIILEGTVGSIPAMQRVQGFKDGLKDLVPSATILVAISANFDRLKALTTTTDLIERFPKIDLIYAANDQMALGAVDALKAKRRLQATKVIGVDGTPDARRAIESGALSATVAQVPYLLGKRTVELAAEVVAGRQVPQRETTETPVLTKEVLDNKNASELRYVR